MHPDAYSTDARSQMEQMPGGARPLHCGMKSRRLQESRLCHCGTCQLSAHCELARLCPAAHVHGVGHVSPQPCESLPAAHSAWRASHLHHHPNQSGCRPARQHLHAQSKVHCSSPIFADRCKHSHALEKVQLSQCSEEKIRAGLVSASSDAPSVSRNSSSSPCMPTTSELRPCLRTPGPDMYPESENDRLKCQQTCALHFPERPSSVELKCHWSQCSSHLVTCSLADCSTGHQWTAVGLRGQVSTTQLQREQVVAAAQQCHRSSTKDSSVSMPPARDENCGLQ